MWSKLFSIIIFIFISIFLSPQLGLAKMKLKKTTAESTTLHKGAWVAGANTVIQINGSHLQSLEDCKAFKVKIDSHLDFNINCKGQAKVETLQLKNNAKYAVSQTGQQITITKYNYLTKSPKTGQMEKSALKIPYVEEVIHLKYQDSGELAFYFEKFKVDEFGRIVQDSFIQVHGLSKKGLNISSVSPQKPSS